MSDCFRVLTCLISVVLCCVVGFGFLVATIVGVAYGYNYSVAEYVQVHKKDVTVYMRRGSFDDSPDFLTVLSGQGTLPTMLREDNQPEDAAAKPLSENWQQSKENKNYADKLNTFDSARRNLAAPSDPTSIPTSSTTLIYPYIQRVTKVSDVAISSSDTPLDDSAVMRKLSPFFPITAKSRQPGANDDFYKSVDGIKPTDGKGNTEDKEKIVLKQKGPIPRPKDADYVYEENFTYTPVK